MLPEKYVVKFIVAKNSVVGLIGKTAEPDSNKSSEVMNQTNAQMKWTISFEPDFIRVQDKDFKLWDKYCDLCKGVCNKFWWGAMEKTNEI